jgi:hypothetical protein
MAVRISHVSREDESVVGRSSRRRHSYINELPESRRRQLSFLIGTSIGKRFIRYPSPCIKAALALLFLKVLSLNLSLREFLSSSPFPRDQIPCASTTSIDEGPPEAASTIARHWNSTFDAESIYPVTAKGETKPDPFKPCSIYVPGHRPNFCCTETPAYAIMLTAAQSAPFPDH